MVKISTLTWLIDKCIDQLTTYSTTCHVGSDLDWPAYIQNPLKGELKNKRFLNIQVDIFNKNIWRDNPLLLK